MPAAKSKKQPAKKPAAIDLEAELARIAARNIKELRGLCRELEGRRPPSALPGTHRQRPRDSIQENSSAPPSSRSREG